MSTDQLSLLNTDTYAVFSCLTGKGPQFLTGYYKGFEVKGGTTIHHITFLTKDGSYKPYSICANVFYGFELVDAPAEASKTVPAAAPSVKKAEDKVVSAAAEQPVKRGRGRPRKEVSAVAATASTASADAAPKKRGRPRKDPTAAAPVKAAPAPTVDAAGAPLPRKRGRPRKDASAVPAQAAPVITASVPAVPPNIPTPNVVEEVDEIEDNDTVVAATSPEKEVKAAIAPVDTAEVTAVASSATENSEPVIVALGGDDAEEVVPARQRLAESRPTLTPGVPSRPVSSLARANRVPDEVDGDL